MKCSLAVAVVIALVSLLIFAETAKAKEGDFKVTLSSRVWSKYVIGAGFRPHDKPVLQTDVFVMSPWGLYLDVWHSMGLDGSGLNSGFGDEIDYTLGWTKKFWQTSIDLGVAYFDVHRLFGAPKHDVLQLFIEINHAIPAGPHTFAPFLRLEYGMHMPGSHDPKPTVDVHLGMTHVMQISKEFDLVAKPQFTFNTGGLFEARPMWLFRPFLGLQWKPWKGVTFEVINLKFSVPMTHTPDARKFEIVPGVGFVYAF